MSHPRTAVAQWHALKAWRPCPPKVNHTFKTLLICTSLKTGTKSHPTIFLSLSLSILLSCRPFLYSLVFNSFPTKKRLSTAKITGRESFALKNKSLREVNRLVFLEKKRKKSLTTQLFSWADGRQNRVTSIIEFHLKKRKTAENNLPNYHHVCVPPPSERTDWSGKGSQTTVQYLAEGGMNSCVCVGLLSLLDVEQCRNSLELFVVCMYPWVLLCDWKKEVLFKQNNNNKKRRNHSL